MTTNNSILLFHRSKNNSEEDLINQQAFLKAHPEIANSSRIIDYINGDDNQRRQILKLTQSPLDHTLKMIVIFQHFLSQRENDKQYQLYRYLKFLRSIDVSSLYLMDCDGKLYKEIEHIDKF